jgi:hypothetical protein
MLLSRLFHQASRLMSRAARNHSFRLRVRRAAGFAPASRRSKRLLLFKALASRHSQRRQPPARSSVLYSTTVLSHYCKTPTATQHNIGVFNSTTEADREAAEAQAAESSASKRQLSQVRTMKIQWCSFLVCFALL